MTSKAKKRKSDGAVVNDVTLAEAVQYLTSCKSRPKIQGNVELQNSLNKIDCVATETGLPAEDITTLVSVAANGTFPEAICSRLIRNLIPATVVPSEAVIRAISWMSTNIPSSKIQGLLVRWIILIYNMLDTLNDLHALYGVLFYFLENEVMCRSVCHLLYLLTRKEDVKLFRVRLLVRLQKRLVFFPQRDRVWLARIKAVADRQIVEGPVIDVTGRYTSEQAKRLKRDVIPSVQSTAVTTLSSDLPKSFGQSVPFSEITSFQLLLQNFDRLELPCQMAAALKNRNLQHVLLCYPDPSIPMRLSYWLDHVLCEEFLVNPSKDPSRAEELLQNLITFTEFLKESVPVCENFLVKYLHVWNGVDFRPSVLKLITRFRLHPFKVLSDLVLEPLRKLFLCSSVYCKCQLLIMFTQLLYNLVTVELLRYRICCKWQQGKNNLEISSVDDSNNVCVFTEEVEEFNPEETISQYVEYVGNLIEVGLLIEQDSPLLMHCILNFYEVLSDLHLEHSMMLIILPRPSVVYTSLFSNSATSLSRMCHIFCRYRENFLSMKNVEVTSLSACDQQYRIMSLKRIKQFNMFIMDYSNSLWRRLAFCDTEKRTIFQMLSETDLENVDSNLYRQCFSLYRHPALVGYFVSYLKPHSNGERRLILSSFKASSGYVKQN
ncbi:hypothetical protein LSH36_189g04025 [Paralvinella palmiformis]|uniref:Centromere protein I n=1 Tax=Paralvinella palmiformis TaxID=53620 RepID=A0AAD9JRD9_9ANNE|nr:hypothetical protein LSH36_189g04025 [Paralvinella palmiformis]